MDPLGNHFVYEKLLPGRCQLGEVRRMAASHASLLYSGNSGGTHPLHDVCRSRAVEYIHSESSLNKYRTLVLQ